MKSGRQGLGNEKRCSRQGTWGCGRVKYALWAPAPAREYGGAYV